MVVVVVAYFQLEVVVVVVVEVVEHPVLVVGVVEVVRQQNHPLAGEEVVA